MSKQFYDGVEFLLTSTTGEAVHFFGGDLGNIADERKLPRIKFAIDANNLVTFNVVLSNAANPLADRPFNAAAIYIDKGSKVWPDDDRELVIGHVDWSKTDERQLFLMWVRTDPQAKDPNRTLRLKMFFFKNLSRFSGKDVALEGIGQDNGGGSGNGPYHP